MTSKRPIMTMCFVFRFSIIRRLRRRGLAFGRRQHSNPDPHFDTHSDSDEPSRVESRPATRAEREPAFNDYDRKHGFRSRGKSQCFGNWDECICRICHR
jgi:hypothetical protein